jgi:hypothetical protein
VQVSSLFIPDAEIEVHMKKYGFVKIFDTINKSGKDRYWETNCLNVDYVGRKNLQTMCWAIEN